MQGAPHLQVPVLSLSFHGPREHGDVSFWKFTRNSKPSSQHRRASGRLTLHLHVIRQLFVFFIPNCLFKVTVQPLLRTFSGGHEDSSSGLRHVHISRSKVLTAFLQTSRVVDKPSVKNATRARCAPLRILAETLSHSIVRAEVPCNS